MLSGRARRLSSLNVSHAWMPATLYPLIRTVCGFTLTKCEICETTMRDNKMSKRVFRPLVEAILNARWEGIAEREPILPADIYLSRKERPQRDSASIRLHWIHGSRPQKPSRPPRMPQETRKPQSNPKVRPDVRRTIRGVSTSITRAVDGRTDADLYRCRPPTAAVSSITVTYRFIVQILSLLDPNRRESPRLDRLRSYVHPCVSAFAPTPRFLQESLCPATHPRS
jgi:hypothetical protein